MPGHDSESARRDEDWAAPVPPGATSAPHGSAAPRDRPPQRNQHVADRKAAAPDRIDHRMIGAGGGVGRRDGGIGAEMPGQIERQLHARRKFRKALVDAELEDRKRGPDAATRCRPRPGYRRRAASRSRTDRFRPAPAVARRMKLASPSCWTSAVPRSPFQPLASSVRNVSIAAATSSGVRATSKRTAPCSASRWRWRRNSFNFLAPSASRSNSSASRVASRQARKRDCSTRGASPSCRSTSRKGFHGGAIQRYVAQDQRVGAGSPRLPQQSRRGIVRPCRDRAAACTACRRDGR